MKTTIINAMPFEPLEPYQEQAFATYCADVLRQVPIVRAECEHETGRSARDAEPSLWHLRAGFYYELAPHVCAAQAFVEEDPENGELLTAWDERLCRELLRSCSKRASFPETTIERCPFCDGPLSAMRSAVERVLHLDCGAADCVGYSRQEGINPWTGTRRTESARVLRQELSVLRRDSRVEVRHHHDLIATFDSNDESFVEVCRIAVSIAAGAN